MNELDMIEHVSAIVCQGMLEDTARGLESPTPAELVLAVAPNLEQHMLLPAPLAIKAAVNLGAFMEQQGWVRLVENGGSRCPDPECTGCDKVVKVTPAGVFLAAMTFPHLHGSGDANAN